MKNLFSTIVLSTCLSGVVVANPIHQDDLGQIFNSANQSSQIAQLTHTEMKETEGAVVWFLPLLYQFGLISTTVGLTSLKVHQILQKVPVSQIYKSARSYKIRNQIKRDINRILNR